MKKMEYIVIGKYDSERNSWIPDGDIRHVCSTHRSEGAAWIAAQKHHGKLGGCDGSDILTSVMRRAPRGWKPPEEYGDDPIDWYDFDGTYYIECDYWSAHDVVFTGSGLAAVPRKN